MIDSTNKYVKFEEPILKYIVKIKCSQAFKYVFHDEINICVEKRKILSKILKVT